MPGKVLFLVVLPVRDFLCDSDSVVKKQIRALIETADFEVNSGGVL
jgi:hypothetical protein